MTTIALQKDNWKSELDKTALRYHTIACWVGIVFNLLFFITDYINIHAYWQPFLAFRVSVSFIILLAVLFRERLKIPIDLLGVIPVLLISIQNAYMWSMMDIDHLQKHVFAYIALFIGSGMFVFYRVAYSVFIVVVSFLANIIYFQINSQLEFRDILVNGGFLTLAVALFSVLLIKTRYNLTKKEIISRLALVEKNAIIEEKNNEILDSISYAKRLQDALIPPVAKFQSILPESFILFKPKDIVSGDFYWITELSTTAKDEKNKPLVVFAAADCTGHGVPGAFMSIISLKALNQSIKEVGINTPGEALDFVNQEVYDTVNKHQTDEGSVIRDGMDIAMCAFDTKTLKVVFAGAHNPLYIIRKGELVELKADRRPIGSSITSDRFNDQEYQLEKGDMLYVFSDGYADQFGGPKGRKFKTKQFKGLLLDISTLPTNQQYEKLNTVFEDWKGSLEQLDDVCVIGVRV